jgi:hypothetical protein
LPVRSPSVLFNRMDDGGVLFCTRTEMYFGINQVGASIWENLPLQTEGETKSFADLLTALQALYPDVDEETLGEDIREFLEAMAQSELVAYASSQVS